ncbi:hypothetical protein EVAR_52437_1 [Eumeta japonica]|uniref:Endonuclease/exonuclease/phosphatase domain-containing protein n=1 Tax=Eumeta variegata TaxID=151549 RepID=A0A4C1YP84_EUMVA|nr:hypothetical protein EVAR_52437_1 [Eumeta japonica]
MCCVRCGGEHATAGCDRPLEDKPTRVNCVEPHMENHRRHPIFRREAREWFKSLSLASAGNGPKASTTNKNTRNPTHYHQQSTKKYRQVDFAYLAQRLTHPAVAPMRLSEMQMEATRPAEPLLHSEEVEERKRKEKDGEREPPTRCDEAGGMKIEDVTEGMGKEEKPTIYHQLRTTTTMAVTETTPPSPHPPTQPSKLLFTEMRPHQTPWGMAYSDTAMMVKKFILQRTSWLGGGKNVYLSRLQATRFPLHVQDVYALFNGHALILIAGDLNAKHKAWGSRSINRTRRCLTEDAETRRYKMLSRDTCDQCDNGCTGQPSKNLSRHFI